jgi:hypothetical protein
MKARQDRNDARAIIDYVAQSHTPQARCVRFGRAVAGRARNTRYEAARFALPRRDPPPLDHAGFSPAHADFKSEWPRSNRNRWPTCSGISRVPSNWAFGSASSVVIGPSFPFSGVTPHPPDFLYRRLWKYHCRLPIEMSAFSDRCVTLVGLALVEVARDVGDHEVRDQLRWLSHSWNAPS